MADDNREQRMEALRARVQAKKAKSNMPEIEEELVVSAEEFEAVVEATELQQEEEWFAMQDRDADRWRNLAGTLILIGSILGLLSGALILQGNPSELLSTSLFDADDAVDISGEILQSMEGNGSEDGGHGAALHDQAARRGCNEGTKVRRDQKPERRHRGHAERSRLIKIGNKRSEPSEA